MGRRLLKAWTTSPPGYKSTTSRCSQGSNPSLIQNALLAAGQNASSRMKMQVTMFNALSPLHSSLRGCPGRSLCEVEGSAENWNSRHTFIHGHPGECAWPSQIRPDLPGAQPCTRLPCKSCWTICPLCRFRKLLAAFFQHARCSQIEASLHACRRMGSCPLLSQRSPLVLAVRYLSSFLARNELKPQRVPRIADEGHIS